MAQKQENPNRPGIPMGAIIVNRLLPPAEKPHPPAEKPHPPAEKPPPPAEKPQQVETPSEQKDQTKTKKGAWSSPQRRKRKRTERKKAAEVLKSDAAKEREPAEAKVAARGTPQSSVSCGLPGRLVVGVVEGDAAPGVVEASAVSPKFLEVSSTGPGNLAEGGELELAGDNADAAVVHDDDAKQLESTESAEKGKSEDMTVRQSNAGGRQKRQRSRKRPKAALKQEDGEDKADAADVGESVTKTTGRHRPKATHFVGFRVSETEILDSVGGLQMEITRQDANLRRAAIPLPLMHVTLSVVHLGNEADIKRACDAMGTLGKEREWTELEGMPLDLEFNGVKDFRGEVVYVSVREGEALNRLKKVAGRIRETFESHGVDVIQERKSGYVAHLTVMKLSRMPSQMKRQFGLKRIDPAFYTDWISREFGASRVGELLLLSMHEKETDGFYKCLSKVSLPCGISDDVTGKSISGMTSCSERETSEAKPEEVKADGAGLEDTADDDNKTETDNDLVARPRDDKRGGEGDDEEPSGPQLAFTVPELKKSPGCKETDL